MALRTGLLSVMAIAALSAPAFADEVIGRNAAVKGTVLIESQGEAAQQAVIREPVRLGDAVTSRLESSLQVLLLDETVFTVGPLAELTIDRFVYDPSQNNNAMSARVKKGMFRFMSGKVAKSGADAVNIDTPVASLGVRGTIVEGLVGTEAIRLARALGVLDSTQSVDPDGATLFVLRGPGPNRNSSDNQGEIIISAGGGSVRLTRPGQAVFVPLQGVPPIGPFRIDQATFEVFNEQLRTSPGTGPGFSPFDIDVLRDPPPLAPAPTPSPVTHIDIFEPAVELDWPEEDIFDSPCGPNSCP